MTRLIELLEAKSEYSINGENFSLELKTPIGQDDGPVRIQVWGPHGPEATLTQYIEEYMHLLAPNQILSKGSMRKYYEPHLEAIGFVYTGHTLPVGPYDATVDIWEFPIVICDAQVNELIEK